METIKIKVTNKTFYRMADKAQELGVPTYYTMEELISNLLDLYETYRNRSINPDKPSESWKPE